MTEIASKKFSKNNCWRKSYEKRINQITVNKSYLLLLPEDFLDEGHIAVSDSYYIHKTLLCDQKDLQRIE